MYCRILRVLMWRHWLSRKRQWILTVFECLSPVLIFMPMVYFRDEWFVLRESEEDIADVVLRALQPRATKILKPKPLHLFNVQELPFVIYTPETNFTRDLMDKVGKKLDLPLLNSSTGKGPNDVRGYFPFAKSFLSIKNTKNLGPNKAVVVFHNVSGHSMPDRLNYSIRMKSPFKEYEPFREHDSTFFIRLLTDPHFQSEIDEDEVFEPFVRLQWSIDSSFIQMLTGKEVKQKVTLKEFRAKDWKKSHAHLLLYITKAFFVYLACGLAMFPIFNGFLSRILIEKASGIQELMKMMGVTSRALTLSHLLNSLVPGLMYSIGATILMKYSSFAAVAVMEHAEAFLVFLMFFLHYFSIISMGFVFSFLGGRATNTGTAVFGIYFGMTMPAFILFLTPVRNRALLHFFGILFVVPLSWCVKEISALEITGEGLNFKTMMKVHSPVTISSSALIAYIFFILQCALCWFLYWYLEKVIRGSLGTALPWNFLCKKSYWKKTPAVPYVDTQEAQGQTIQYYEPPPENLEAGIKAINVTKDYSKNPGALDNLSLNVYKGEITILLGHNGAGKSTLMSIITGMSGATKGKVLVNGYDILSQKEQARRHIGLCPQHNMFMKNVSVKEHIMFFALIKKGTFEEARESAEEILENLNISDKADADTSELSGGMKRRVQLACALAGDASVLLLDEPTSGLDVETRRSLWDMLLSLRGDRTVLLTTHFMEEADALGDRVALLHAGKLRCYGTSFFLKQAVGAGYRLSVTTSNEPNEPAITSAVTSVIPDATVKMIGFNSISYNLPLANIKNYPNLFSMLESKKSELGIDSIGVGASTLEEVVLRLSSEDTPINPGAATPLPTYQKLTGMPLYTRQLKSLIMRYLRFVWTHKISQIGLGIILLSACIFITTAISNEHKRPQKNETETLRARTLNMDNPLIYPRIMYKVDGNYSGLRMLRKRYPRVHFENVSDISKAVLRARHRNEVKNSNYIAAIEVNDTDAKVFYRNVDAHASAAALNLLSNMLVAWARPQLRTGGLAITANNQPLADNEVQLPTIFETPKSSFYVGQWSILMVILMVTAVVGFLSLPTKEYNSGVRLNHLLAGCLPELHWVAMLLAITLQICVTYVIVIMIACATLDTDKTFTDVTFLFVTGLVVLLGCLASFVFSCFVTFHCTENVATGVVIGLNFVFTIFVPVLLAAMGKTSTIAAFFEMFIPQFTFYEAIYCCAKVAALNAYCKLNRDKCPKTDILSMHFEGGKCCGSTSNPVAYLTSSNPSPGMYILILFLQIIAYMILLCLTQRCVFSWLREKCVNCRYKEPALRCNDEDVKLEQQYVKNTIKLPTKNIPDILLVSNVHKNYYMCTKAFNAVKGVSFSIKKGECFGLLGVNGAGKSSMFQMLAVGHCTTRGRIFANGHHLKIPCHNKYLRSLAYCPQFMGLDDFLTGRQNLEVMLSINGLNPRDTSTEALTWIRLVALEKYFNRIVSEYSGGCMRRMAAAVALCTGAPLSLLDEPTSGVDVVARRAVWLALERALQERRAVIITSHSIDETEWLCHRVAIMAAGEMWALGSPAALRAAYSHGHAIVFKLKHISEADETAEKQVDQLKSTIEKKFDCVLKDQHKTMLHYHINETMNYSKLFQDMEQIKSSSSGLVEDFSVSETTLEEVFISFSRIQEEDIAEQKKSKSRKKAEEKNKNKTEGISETKPGGKIVKKTGFKSEDQIVEKRDSKTDKKTGEKSGDKTEDKRDKATGGEDGSKPKDGNAPGSSKKSGPGPRK